MCADKNSKSEMSSSNVAIADDSPSRVLLAKSLAHRAELMKPASFHGTLGAINRRRQTSI